MSTSEEFMIYLSDQLRDAGIITYRKMFGEYTLYCDSKVIGLVCDGQFFLKKTEAGRELLKEVCEAPAYNGAKPSFLITLTDDREYLTKLVRATCNELPYPKQKKKKGVIMMKVIALNGSPRKEGNTAYAIKLMAEELRKEGIETEIIEIGHLAIHGCTGCGYCTSSEKNECVFKDDPVNETAAKIREADGLILASPTYYAGIAGTMKSFLDRLFYSSSRHFKYKVATAVTSVRRTGGIDTLHQLNNYLNLAQTVTPPSQYWTVVYGQSEGEMTQDLEGVQTIRKNAGAMAWLIKVINEGRKTIPLPDEQKRIFTNFIR